MRPFAGRWFEAADSIPNAEPVVILSWELWQRSFGGGNAIVGQQITVNNVSRRVVGIMPRGYDLHDQKIEIWRPLTIDPSTFPNNRGSHGFYLVGRLKPGVTIAQARADLEVLLRQWNTLAAEQALTESDQSSLPDRSAEGRHGRLGAAGAARAAGRRRVRPVDRVREPREPADRARRLADARVRDAIRARRVALAPAPAADHGRSGPVGRGRDGRLGARVGRAQGAARRQPRRASRDRPRCRSTGA